ncbi:MAG: prepilin-type N-terminal cleavage/methylation domain-containing protein [Kofleriaceae bacterium]|nr:prepilin-type N-terminal cleavage/methylation domain-containing protein [Kofleriaceae bacterium]MBP9203185.1 prepilin-type N-terminal cleavage/methylation domain-containing protein [Kofleriaceae bacterium]
MSRVRRAAVAGFTLLEVMIALAILAMGLTVLMARVTGNIRASYDAEALTIVTDLARSKMYDLEEVLMKDGFLETDQSSEGDFGDEGHPKITWKAKVEAVEIPSYEQLVAMQQAENAGAGSGSGSGSGSGAGSGGFGDSALGGMLGMLGGGFDAADAGGASFIQGQFQLVQEVLKASIRKVTLTVTYQVLGEDDDLTVVAYFTDPAGMTKTIGNIGASAPSDSGAGGAGGASGGAGGGPRGGGAGGGKR